MRRFITVLAFSIAASATPAVADELTRSVPVTQADLQTEKSVASLYSRIENVAKSLCTMANPALYGYNSAVLPARAECVREAVDRAMINANSPTLAAHHAQTLASRRPDGRTETLAAR